MKLRHLLLLLAGLPHVLSAQSVRTIHTISATATPILPVGSLATRRLAEGSDKGEEGKMGVLLFSKDSATEPKRKYVGDFITGGALKEGTLTFKNGDVYDGTFNGNEYDKGTYRSKRGGWSYKGIYNQSDMIAWTEMSFPNGDTYTGMSMNRHYWYGGTYRFADGETIIAERWEDDMPLSAIIVLAGKSDSIRGAFSGDGELITFASSNGKLKRSYRCAAAPANNPVTSVATPSVKAAEPRCVKGNCITGKGRLFYPADSSYYEGSFVAGQREGKGIFEDRYTYYSGEWKSGQWSGKGIAIKKSRSGYKRPIDTMSYKQGVFIAGVLNGEGIDHQSDNLYYKGTFKDGKLNGQGLYDAAGIIYEGNFKDGQLSGHGSLTSPGLFYMVGDTWTDNDHMARGKFHNGNMGPTDSVYVMYEKGDFFTDERLAGKKEVDAKAAERAAAKGRPSVYTKYVFISDCNDSRQRTFKTVCKVDADLSKHSFEEVRAEASRLLNSSGRNCGSVKYLGPDSDVHIDGQAGRDYAITGGMMMD